MDEVKIVKQIVINQAFGGFGLSEKARQIIARRKGWIIDDEGFIKGTEFQTVTASIERDDPVLVEVVQELGEEANGRSANLKVVQVTVVIDIENHDGYERVHVGGGQY